MPYEADVWIDEDNQVQIISALAAEVAPRLEQPGYNSRPDESSDDKHSDP